MQNGSPVDTICGGAAMSSTSNPISAATSAAWTCAPKRGATCVISIQSSAIVMSITPAPVSSRQLSPVT